MPERIQLSRRRGWRKPPGAVFVARPSRWGNPWRVERFGRAQAVALYRTWLDGSLTEAEIASEYGRDSFAVAKFLWLRRTELIKRLNAGELRGRDLACWCRLDQPCHADVLLEAANG